MATAAAMVSSGSLSLPTNAPMPSTMAAYTAVTPADNRVNSSARLMMTSMSNSRYRRIAMAMATGMPRNTRNGVMAFGTACNGPPCWPVAIASTPMTWQISTPTTTSASHFICWRSRWSPRRYRSTKETTAGASSSTNSTTWPFRVPSRSAGPRVGTASGLGYLSEMPPGAGSVTVRVLTANVASPRPVSPRPASAAGRQRGDGSRPVGKSRKMATRPVVTMTKEHSASAPTAAGTGSVPGLAFSPTTA